ncbi:hypothetical protein D9M72_92480 [compost metagenome]
MTDTPSFVPLSESANGKTNSFCLQCKKAEQTMSYAACLNRIEVLRANAAAPKDWNVCEQALRFGQCIARDMRQEEELAGTSIYFRAREAIQSAAAAAARWFMPGDKKVKPAARSGSVLDVLGDTGSLADAISGSAASVPHTPTARVIPISAVVGETPLQIARRLRAEQEVANA